MSTYAQVQHVEEAWPRPFAAAEVAHVQHALNRAERLLARNVDVPARVELGLCTMADVRDVVVAMVTRLLGNPQGVRQQSAGPYSVTVDRSVASGKLEFTKDDRAQLGGSTGGASTITVVDPALPKVTRRVSTSGTLPPGVWP